MKRLPVTRNFFLRLGSSIAVCRDPRESNEKDNLCSYFNKEGSVSILNVRSTRYSSKEVE